MKKKEYKVKSLKEIDMVKVLKCIWCEGLLKPRYPDSVGLTCEICGSWFSVKPRKEEKCELKGKGKKVIKKLPRSRK